MLKPEHNANQLKDLQLRCKNPRTKRTVLKLMSTRAGLKRLVEFWVLLQNLLIVYILASGCARKTTKMVKLLRAL